MNKTNKKQWQKPTIKTSLSIKETLAKGGSGQDGGTGNQTRS